LTFDLSNIDFLSYLENPVALSHISELHILLWKLSHTHIAWVKFTIEKCLSAGIWSILVYFWNAIWLFYQLFIDVCSEANVREIFFCIFPSVFQLLVWSVRTDMFLLPDTFGSIDLLSDSMLSGWVCTTFERELFAFSAKHTTFLLFYHVMLCVFSLGLIPRFWHSLHIFSHSQVFPLSFLILLSFGSL
jgi:hypothetical protein